MAAQITTYAGLKAGMLAWLARTGDALLDARFDDFLLNCERRMYYGFAVDEPGEPAALGCAAHRRDGDRRCGLRAQSGAWPSRRASSS